LLITSDGASSIVDCSFVDDNFVACANVPRPTSTAFQQSNVYSLGTGCYGPSGTCNTPAPTLEQDTYVTKVQVWTCNRSSNTYCNGSTLVNGPPAGLTYWR
jgi:hypothetical protein